MRKYIWGAMLAVVMWTSALAGLHAAPPTPELAAEARLWAEFAHAPDQPLRFIVYFQDKADVSAAYKLPTRAERAAFVYNQLQNTATRSQQDAVAFVQMQQGAGAAHIVDSLWICNALVMEGDEATARALAAREEVAYVALDEKVQYLDPPLANARPDLAVDAGNIEWNITQIGADRVWNELGVTGEGVVVANLDTGVYLHPALIAQYRGNLGDTYEHDYNWYDTTGTYLDAPNDGHWHGTHTMGTMVGAVEGQNIGVAPGARWIAIKGLDDWGNGYDSQIHAAFQWLLAPTDLSGANPDPSRAPHIVNNSWGASDGKLIKFHDEIEMLIAAGIVPIFSAGNKGPEAGTIGAPASFEKAFCVGAVNDEDTVANFSSRGPSPLTDALKPEISAPGVEVNSSVLEDGYSTESGTSMAAPHVSGVAALMLSSNPMLSYDQIRFVITDTAVDLGEPGADYHYGWGRVDAYAAVHRVQLAGKMYGQLRDSANAGVAAGAVTAVGHTHNYLMQQPVDAQGYYTLPLPVGTYTITADAYGYYSTATTVTVVTNDADMQRDFTLSLKPRYRLSGRVVDRKTGLPLTATITILNSPITPLSTTASAGTYETEIAAGTYKLQVDKFGYEMETRTIEAQQDITENFALTQLAPILLVDDDNNAADQLPIETALTGLRQSYRVWDTSRSGTPPAYYLRQYAMIIWNTGQERANSLSFNEQDALSAYLAAGGNLLLSSKGYAADDVYPILKQDYLHFTSENHWRNVVDIEGVEGNPIGTWMGTMPVIVDNYSASSLIPDEFALSAYTSAGHTMAVTYHDRVLWYRAAFFSVGLESLDPGGLQSLLQRVIRWFEQSSTHNDITGRVTNVYTDEGAAGIAVTAQGEWDGYTTLSDARGYYTLSLLLGNYDLTFDHAGYFSAEIYSVPVTTETRTTRAISLTPHVLLAPTTLSRTVVAGEFWTTTLTISNAGSSAFHYGSYNRDVTMHIAAAETATLDIPYSEIAPTIDGYYTEGEWEDANVAFLTDFVQPTGAEMGQALVKHAGDRLYVLMDYEGMTSSSVNISAKIWLDLDGDGESDGGFHARKYYNSLHKYFDYAAEVEAKRSTTPADSQTHWIFEFAIPLETVGLELGRTYPVHFILYDEASKTGGEWANVTKESEEAYPERWEAMHLLPRRALWFSKSPVGAQLGATDTLTVELTLDGRVVQPGQHYAEWVLPSRHQDYPIINPVIPLSFTIVPAADMGKLAGAITDRRTGQPLTATVAEVGGLAVETEPLSGTYAIWLHEGTRELALSAAGYLPRRVLVTMTAGITATQNFTLQFDSPELLLPPAPEFTLDYGTSLTAALVIGNDGSQPLEFQIYETTISDDLHVDIPDVQQYGVHHDDELARRSWARLQVDSSDREAQRVFVDSTAPADVTLNPFLFDPLGEEAEMVVDLVRAETMVEYAALMQHFRLTFSPESDLLHTAGYVHLDADRVAETGRPPSALYGKYTQDIGYDYYFDLFPMVWASEIDLRRATGEYVLTAPGAWYTNTLEWSIPLSWLQSIDGVMDVALVVGDESFATDWGPMEGHSTVGVGANWLVETPDNGAVGVTEVYTVVLHLDGAELQPGAHALRLALRTNDPISPTAYVPISVTVSPTSQMQKVNGTVLDRATYKGARALVAVEGGGYTFSDAATGAYELWLPIGIWRIRAATAGVAASAVITVSVDGVQGAENLDFMLGDYAVYLPLVLKE